MNAEHPSFLQLDELALADFGTEEGARGPAALREHVSTCDQCEHYIERHRQVDALPAALRRRAVGARVLQVRDRRRWFAWVGPLAIAGAAAAALLFFLTTRQGSSLPIADEYIGVKGDRTIGLYIKRDDAVTMWNGRSSIVANDRLRLAVISRGHTHVAVFARVQDANETRFESIYRGPLEASGATLLPKAWKVDAEAGPEILLVVTSEGALDPEPLRSTFEELIKGPNPKPVLTHNGLWIRPLILAKEPTP